MHLAIKIFFVTLSLFFIDAKLCAQSKKYILPADTVLKKVNARPIARKIVKPKPLIKEFGLGLIFASNGTQLSFRKYKDNEEATQAGGFYVNLGQIKHPREALIKGIRNTQDPDKEGALFAYSKINNLLNLQLGYSMRKKISGFLEGSNVVIHGFGDAGLSVGFLKPYYLSIARSNSSNQFFGSDEKYSDSNAVQFLDKRYIYSKSPFTVGLNEAKVQIGLNLKSGLQFEYIPKKYAGVLVEIGAGLDVFATKQQILVTQKAQQIYPSVFAGIRYCIKAS